jgi:uncharacterized membrane protein YfcA
MIKIFLLSYFQLLLLNLQSRLLNRGQYLGMVVTSTIVGVLYCFMFKNLMEQIDHPSTIVAYVAGTVLGGMSGVWVHQRFFKEKEGICHKK